MNVRHPNRPRKHGHNPKACGLCKPNKKFSDKFTARERMVREAP